MFIFHLVTPMHACGSIIRSIMFLFMYLVINEGMFFTQPAMNITVNKIDI